MEKGFSHFDAIVYINLSHRKDREKLLLEELQRCQIDFDKLIRIEGVHDILNGHRGCAKSHKKALQIAKDNMWSNVLILEDDVIFIEDVALVSSSIDHFFNNLKNDWDVFFLAANVFSASKTKDDRIKRVLSAQCAHAYAVNQSYFDALIECFSQSIEEMKEDLDFSDSLLKAIDQRWKLLQPFDRWYITDVLGQQRRSYSDIEHKIKDRKHLDFTFFENQSF